MSKLSCPECGDRLVLREGKHNKFYGCVNSPVCKGSHSAHQNSGKPLGTPADAETKQWRVKAHNALDRLWKEWGYKRNEAYGMLQTIMDMKPYDAHISRFTKEDCQKLLKLLEEDYK